MSFRAYPSYKSSGVAWLGEVPQHWVVRRLGQYFTERREKVSDTEYPPLSVTKQGVVPQLETAAKTDDNDNRKRVCKGDFVINSRSDRKGSAGLSALDGSVSLINIVIRPNDGINSRFVNHLLRSQPFQEEFYRWGKGIVADLWSTNYSEMRSIVLAMPPLDEQTVIANFLDEEVSGLNALVAEQQHLLELLNEKRQAIIAHVVAKGLDACASMKDTGIEWLGVVPAHWNVCLLKRVLRAVDYGISESLDTNGDVAVLRMGNIVNGRVSFDDLRFTNAVDPSLLLEEGDLLYNRTNSLELIGKVGLFRGNPGLPTSFASYLVRLRLGDESIPAYFAYLLNTEAILGVARANAFVAIGQCNLNPARYGHIKIAVPPRREQLAITDYLDRATRELDQLIVEAQRGIALLHERRTALIAAAVTGKIDVREVARAEAA